MTSRTRLRVLIVAAFTLLAFATHAETRDLHVIPADADLAAVTADLAPAEFWCAARRPHAADEVVFADFTGLHAGVVTGRCAAHHPGSSHFYYVTIWDLDGDGVIERIDWTPLGPWWT